MAIDPSRFYLHNVADSCAIWNILASQLLYSRALQEQCSFYCTEFVHYECAHKRRTYPTEEDNAIRRSYLREMEQRRIERFSIDLDDLQEIGILEQRRRLSRGELSTIVFARKTRQAVLTDDQKARKLSSNVVGTAMTQTTPHLVGWLAYNSKLNDEEMESVVEDQRAHNRSVYPHTRSGYQIGVEARSLHQRGIPDIS